MSEIDILIPTYHRAAALGITLACLVGQSFQNFRVIISDQSTDYDVSTIGEVQAVVEVLRYHGHPVKISKHLPRRGMAEQRQFLLDQARAPYALFLDDDLILEPDALAYMLAALEEENCGFVGCAVPGLKYLRDVRPHQQQIEFWEGPVHPEMVIPDSPEWSRVQLHNAANILHVADRLGITRQNPRKYKIAWVGGCVLFNTAKLRKVGGFSFWPELPPEHSGEDVLAQLRVMARFGGCGLIPTRVYHQVLPTTVPNRTIDAPKYLK